MLRRIRLLNCQSLADVTFEFATDKLNVIAAENDTGKSVLFKILKLAGCPKYFDKEERISLIHYDAPYAMVLFEFTDGGMALMKILPEKVIYAYREAGEKDATAYLEPPKRMLEQLGLLSDVNGKFVANIIDSDQDLLLVDPNVSYSTDLIHMLVFNEDMDRLRDVVDTLLDEFKEYELRTYNYLEILNRQLRTLKYQDVSSMEEMLESAEVYNRVLFQSIDAYELLRPFASDAMNVTKLSHLISTEEILEDLEELHDLINQVQPVKELPPVSILDCLDRCEEAFALLENVKVEEKRLVSEKFVDALEETENLLQALKDVKTKDFNGMVYGLNALENLESVEELVQEVLIERNKAVSSINEIAQLKEAFANSGEVLDCPIHGKVVFDGENCVADSF